MPGRRIDPGSPPLLDIHTYGRAARHLSYLSRNGDVEIETDDGRNLKGKGLEEAVIDDWDLDVDQMRPSVDLRPRASHRPPPKLVHKLMFSMPAGTPAQKVLAAVEAFAREEFGAKHRYAMVLHTDEPHPHVHLVVKALSEEGERLNIRKAILREWRRQFARRLREQGLSANATSRAARGAMRPSKLDGIHRAAMRGASTHYKGRAHEVARDLVEGTFRTEPGKERLLATRRAVVEGWTVVSAKLADQGELELARAVREFAAQLPPPLTERETLRGSLLEKSRGTRDPQR